MKLTKWARSMVITVTSTVLMLIAIAIASLGYLKPEYLIGVIGIISFTGSITTINFLSGSYSFDKGEIRKTITITTFLIYFVMLGLSSYGIKNEDKEQLKFIMQHYTYLVELIAAFYFSTKALERFRKNKEEKEENPKSE